MWGTGEKIRLPFRLEAQYETCGNLQPEFYSILADLPFGIDSKEGSIIIAGDPIGQSVIIKAWKFDDCDVWEKVDNRPPETNAAFVKIEDYFNASTRIIWTPPGIKQRAFRCKEDITKWEISSSVPQTFREFVQSGLTI